MRTHTDATAALARAAAEQDAEGNDRLAAALWMAARMNQDIGAHRAGQMYRALHTDQRYGGEDA